MNTDMNASVFVIPLGFFLQNTLKSARLKSDCVIEVQTSRVWQGQRLFTGRLFSWSDDVSQLMFREQQPMEKYNRDV